MKIFAISFIALLGTAPTEKSLHFSVPKTLKTLKDIATILAFSTMPKLIRLEPENDGPVHNYESKQLETEEHLTLSHIKNFPWEEFERLEQGYEQGRYLTHAEFIRFLELKSTIKNRELIHPEQVVSEPTKPAASAYNLPGMRMAGGCCSKPTTAPPLKHLLIRAPQRPQVTLLGPPSIAIIQVHQVLLLFFLLLIRF